LNSGVSSPLYSFGLTFIRKQAIALPPTTADRFARRISCCTQSLSNRGRLIDHISRPKLFYQSGAGRQHQPSQDLLVRWASFRLPFSQSGPWSKEISVSRFRNCWFCLQVLAKLQLALLSDTSRPSAKPACSVRPSPAG
jgi:hypothetical protein